MLLAVALGGAIGSAARWWIGGRLAAAAAYVAASLLLSVGAIIVGMGDSRATLHS